MSQQEGSIAHSHQTRESTYRYRPSLVCRIVASVTVLSACSSLSACRYSGEQDAPTKVVTRIMCYGFGCEMVGASSSGRHHFLKCHFLPLASGRSWSRYTRRPRQELVTDGRTTARRSAVAAAHPSVLPFCAQQHSMTTRRIEECARRSRAGSVTCAGKAGPPRSSPHRSWPPLPPSLSCTCACLRHHMGCRECAVNSL